MKENNKILEIIDDIEANPKLNNVFEININLKEANYVICLGGGSVIDFAKAAIAFNGCDRNRIFFRETITLNKEFNLKMIPEIIAVPTTSGTGSELNSWGTIWEEQNKYSVIGDKLLPSIIILDCSLCITMPASLTISSGLDAFSHAIESIWNKNNNPIVDEISKIAIRKIKKYLPLVIEDKENLNYRKEMQMAAFFAGIAMSKTKTAICHSISYPITSLFGISHGIACSLTLSEVSKLMIKKHKTRCEIVSKAMGCKNKELENTILDFFKKMNYGKYLNPIKNIPMDETINFINPARAKNSLIKVTNIDAVNMVRNAIRKLAM